MLAVGLNVAQSNCELLSFSNSFLALLSEVIYVHMPNLDNHCSATFLVCTLIKRGDVVHFNQFQALRALTI